MHQASNQSDVEEARGRFERAVTFYTVKAEDERDMWIDAKINLAHLAGIQFPLAKPNREAVDAGIRHALECPAGSGIGDVPEAMGGGEQRAESPIWIARISG